MKKAILLFALFYILAACQARLTPAPVEVSPTPSRTPSPTLTPTPNATERYQGTLQANQTQNAGYALTQGVRLTEGAQTRAVEALTPTLTNTPVPTPTPKIPQGSYKNYGLAQPSFEGVMQALFKSIDQVQNNNECSLGEPCEEIFYNRRDAEYFGQLMSFEVNRFFPQGFPDQEIFLSVLTKGLEDRSPNRYWPEMIGSNLAQITVDYLTENKVMLINEQMLVEPFVELTPYQIELDHDPKPEWLLHIVYPEYPYMLWIAVDQGENNQFYLASDLLWEGEDYFTMEGSLMKIGDLTGDELTDVILVLDTYGLGLNRLIYKVAINVGGKLQVISTIDASYSGRGTTYVSYDLIVSNYSLPALRIVETTYGPWDCETEVTTTYEWHQGIEHIEQDTPDPTIGCLIGQAVDPYEPLELSVAIQWLENALKLNEATLTLKPEDLIYVYYRLALLNALEGEDVIARQYANRIKAASTRGETEIANHLWNQIKPLLSNSNLSPYLLCKASEDIALPVTDIDIFGEIFSYPYSGYLEGFPIPLCETHRIQLTILNDLKFTSTLSLELALQNADLPLIRVEQIPLSNSQLAFVVLIQEQGTEEVHPGLDEITNYDGILVYGYLEGYGWTHLTTFLSAGDFHPINTDLTGDGIPEIGFAVQGGYGNCTYDEEEYQMVLISGIGYGYIATIEDDSVCVNEIPGFDWLAFAVDRNKDGLSDWVIRQTFSALDDPSLLGEEPVNVPWVMSFRFWRYIPEIEKDKILDDLHNRFFTSLTPSLLRPDIEFYRSRWGAGDDPTSEQIHAHLTYLLALTYELEGDETRAVALFYDLWANHPDTLWAYLAASRLEPK